MWSRHSLRTLGRSPGHAVVAILTWRWGSGHDGGASKAPWSTIVGVVGDVRHEVFDREPPITVYVPYRQAPRPWTDIVLRASVDPLTLASAVQSKIRNTDGEQFVYQVKPIERLMDDELIGLGFVATLMTTFGTVALAALTACYLPARRAAGVDPVVALRHE